MITKVAFVAHPTSNMNDMKQFYGEHLGLELKPRAPARWPGQGLAASTGSRS